MQSPFILRFDTNYAPTEDELGQISQLLIEPTIQRDGLDTEISRLQAKRDRLNDFITPHLILSSPIRRISQDVLQEIFVRCLPTKHNSIMSRREPPLLLGRVCSSWRNISRTTSKLWSSIHISSPDSFYGHEPDDDKAFTQAIIDWLNRSGALPLSISVHQGVGHAYPVKHKLIPCLRPFAPRWRHVELSLRQTDFPALAAFSAEELPLLKSFSIQFHMDYERRDRGPAKPYGLFQAPCLQGLLICSSLVSSASINWSQLIELIITETEHDLRVGMALAILTRCHNLINCTMEFAFSALPQPQTSAPSGMVILPLLRSLTVSGGSNLGLFFDHLSLPVLLDFTLHVSHSYHNQVVFEWPPLCAFLRHLTTLDRFSISAHSVRRETLINCIIEIPHITKLHLTIYSGDKGVSNGSSCLPADDHLLGLLTPTINKVALCPFLRIFECSPSSISDDALLEFIYSRTTLSSTYDVAKLERAHIGLPREKGEHIFVVPPEVVSEGTKIKVFYEIRYSHIRHALEPSRGVMQRRKLSSWSAASWEE